MNNSVAVINGIEHKDIIYDDPISFTQGEKIEDTPLKIYPVKDGYNRK